MAFFILFFFLFQKKKKLFLLETKQTKIKIQLQRYNIKIEKNHLFDVSKYS